MCPQLSYEVYRKIKSAGHYGIDRNMLAYNMDIDNFELSQIIKYLVSTGQIERVCVKHLSDATSTYLPNWFVVARSKG